jgi:cytochrome c553
MNKRNYFLLFIVFFILLVAARLLFVGNKSESTSSTDQILPKQISYNFHVKPILSDKCFACHGPDANKRQAGLRLDVEADAMAELPENPGKFAILPANAVESELVKRIDSEDESIIMPPIDSHLKLTDFEKSILKEWIRQGAKYERHWSFIPPIKHKLPDISNSQSAINEIDYFILQKLEKQDLDPAEQAMPEKLLRRLSLDVTGLPPSTEDVHNFIENDELDFEAAVDYYISKPAYGEKMARDWMDVSRYADSHGYQDDSYRTMWPWRDWVIHAYNQNMPYDQFLVWQIAGDLLPNASKEHLLATAFNRNHPITQEGGVIDEEYRSTYVSDRTNTLGKGIMGLTLECAKCHDHKYDPISQKDYFSIYAFFNHVNEKGLQMDAVQAKNRKYYADAPYIEIEDDDLENILSFVNRKDTSELKVMVMNDSTQRETFILARGNYDAPTEKVEPVAPEFIMEYPDALPKNRLGLAQWLTDDQNPLTARVYVNRLWSVFFGQGIVKTIEDFGSQGALPTHPKLLDWLAADFMEHDWDTKYIVKKIVMSATYRQSSVLTKQKKELDPENIYLSRGPRFRLSAEEIRDYVLATSDLLNDELGGPSVKPYQPAGLWEETNAGGNRGILTKYVEDTGDRLYRRSLYTFWKRTLPPPSMSIFDAPNRDLCEVRRQKTNTPLQALAMQNDVQVLEGAKVLANNVHQMSLGEQERIEALFAKVLLRAPKSEELDLLSDYYEASLEKFEANEEDADKLLKVGEKKLSIEEKENVAALMMVAQVLYNLDETITKE